MDLFATQCIWDWSLSQWLTGLLQCFDAVGWDRWVILPVKIVIEVTYNVSTGTLRRLTHSYSLPYFT